MLGKLQHSTDVDSNCRLTRQILDVLDSADYRTSQVIIPFSHVHSLVLRLTLVSYCKRRKAGHGLGTRLPHAYIQVPLGYNMLQLNHKKLCSVRYLHVFKQITC